MTEQKQTEVTELLENLRDYFEEKERRSITESILLVGIRHAIEGRLGVKEIFEKVKPYMENKSDAKWVQNDIDGKYISNDEAKFISRIDEIIKK